MGHKSWGVVGVVAASVLLGACSSVGVGVGTSTTIYDPQQARPGR
ncbi:hypothetical protein [Rhodoferax sp.]|nr:hypothetical protein [Rhodoferax sp.]